MRHATELDVANIRFLANYISCLKQARRYDELVAAQRRMAALKPDHFEEGYQVAITAFHATGSTQEGEAFFAHLSQEEANSPEGIDARVDWAGRIGNFAEQVRLQRLKPYTVDEELSHWEQDVLSAETLYLTGEKAGAVARLGSIPDDLMKRLEREPKNPRLWTFQGIVYMILGKPAEAVSAAGRAAGLVPMSLDQLDFAIYASFSALIYDHAGDKERALAEYTRLLRTPAAELLNVYEMKRDTTSSLHGDPRFDALLSDPANNAPLF
jgi:tetratricopeptide (TPR) repeat protein